MQKVHAVNCGTLFYAAANQLGLQSCAVICANSSYNKNVLSLTQAKASNTLIKLRLQDKEATKVANRHS